MSIYKQRNEELEDRIIDFTISVNKLLEKLPRTNFGINLANQISRSSISPALNYGEVQAAESTKDFIHKMGICLKELRETFIGLKIIYKGQLIIQEEKNVILLRDEANELISIFVASIKTSKRKL